MLAVDRYVERVVLSVVVRERAEQLDRYNTSENESVRSLWFYIGVVYNTLCTEAGGLYLKLMLSFYLDSWSSLYIKRANETVVHCAGMYVDYIVRSYYVEQLFTVRQYVWIILFGFLCAIKISLVILNTMIIFLPPVGQRKWCGDGRSRRGHCCREMLSRCISFR